MKKGGYQVVDLKDYNITSEGVKIKGIYDYITENKRKVILLSGVTIKGVLFSDMFVKVVKAGTDFRLTGYSVLVEDELSTYDFFVEDDDTVTLIEETTASGMTNPMTTAGDIIVGGDDGEAERLAAGTSAQMLVIDPVTAKPTWTNQPSPGMANPMTTMGDLIVGGVDGVAGRIGKGTAGQFLRMNSLGTLPVWETVPAANGNSF